MERYYSGQKANILRITKKPFKMQQAAVKDNILQLAAFCFQHAAVCLCSSSDVEQMTHLLPVVVFFLLSLWVYTC